MLFRDRVFQCVQAVAALAIVCGVAFADDIPEAVVGINVDVAEQAALPGPQYFWPTGPEPACSSGFVDTFNGGCTGSGEAFSLAEIPLDLANIPFVWGGQSGTYLIDDGSGGQIATRDFDAFLIDIGPSGLDFDGVLVEATVTTEFPAAIALVDSECSVIESVEVAGNCAPLSLTLRGDLAETADLDGLMFIIVSPLDSEVVVCGADYTVSFDAVTEITVPTNDACIDAITIPIGATVSGSTVAATSEDPSFDGCGSIPLGRGVWYSITMPPGCPAEGRDLTLSLCDSDGGSADYASSLSVYCNGCFSPVCVASDSGSCASGMGSRVTFAAALGTTYLVLVHGAAGETGDFTLWVIDGGPTPASACVPFLPPQNATCETAIALGLAGSGKQVVGSTLGACGFGPPDPPIFDCIADGSGSPPNIVAPTLWYVFTGDGNDVVISTCHAADYDTSISVYCVACDDRARICAGGNEDGVDEHGVPCGNFTSRLVFPTLNSEEYLIAVHGFAADSFGTFTLTLMSTGVPSTEFPCDQPSPIACNPADLNDAASPSPAFPDFGVSDGILTPTDFSAFSFFFSTGDLRADLNDAAAPSPAFPSFGIPDGILTPTDFSAFVAYFNAGCPCSLPGCD